MEITVPLVNITGPNGIKSEIIKVYIHIFLIGWGLYKLWFVYILEQSDYLCI